MRKREEIGEGRREEIYMKKIKDRITKRSRKKSNNIQRNKSRAKVRAMGN